jgi:hypothetical protein
MGADMFSSRFIPLIALVAPATLSVKSDFAQSYVMASVPTPLVPQFIPFNETNATNVDAALSRWALLTAEGGHGDYRTTIPGPTDQFARLILSTVTTGQVFPINQPFQGADSSYSIDFIAPAVRCGKSTAEVARNTTLAAIHSQGYSSNKTDNFSFNVSGIDFKQLSFNISNPGGYNSSYPVGILHVGYFAMIPFAGAAEDNSSHIYDMNHISRDLSSFDDIGYSAGNKNELNILIADHSPETNVTMPTYVTCQLWNGSWTVHIDTTNNTQTVRTTDVQLLNLAQAPLRAWGDTAYSRENSSLNLNQALYTTFFQGVAKHLLGFVGTSRVLADVYASEVGPSLMALSNIQQTVLAGSTEYLAMLQNLSNVAPIPDKGAMHKPLGAMIEEFSQNLTLNLMTDEFFR